VEGTREQVKKKGTRARETAHGLEERKDKPGGKKAGLAHVTLRKRGETVYVGAPGKPRRVFPDCSTDGGGA